MGHLGRQDCLLESFHGGQLRDLSKSEKWKQLGMEAALPGFPCSPLPVSLSVHRPLRRSLRVPLAPELLQLQASPWPLLGSWWQEPLLRILDSLQAALWEQRVMEKSRESSLFSLPEENLALETVCGRAFIFSHLPFSWNASIRFLW